MEARRLYEAAIALDPKYSRAYALLAVNYNVEWERDLDASDKLLETALNLAKAQSSSMRMTASATMRWAWCICIARGAPLAEHHCREALGLQSQSPYADGEHGPCYTCLGEPEKAIALFKEPASSIPYYQSSWYSAALAGAHFDARHYDEAVADELGHVRQLVALKRPARLAHATLGQEAEARRYRLKKRHCACRPTSGSPGAWRVDPEGRKQPATFDRCLAQGGAPRMTALGVRRERRRFLVVSHPATRYEPEATGAVMEVTKWLKPSDSGSQIGDRASESIRIRMNYGFPQPAAHVVELFERLVVDGYASRSALRRNLSP